MPEKRRIRNLSTRWLLPFKILIVTVYVILCGFFSYVYIFEKENLSSVLLGIPMAGIYGYFFYQLIRLTLKIHRVEFDEEFMYVLRKENDIIIPLENIESVEISTVGGVYKVNLFNAEQLGKEFYFKQSLWYPLNYKRCDDLVNVLRRNIQSAKLKIQVIPANALHS